jgi:hypothetical protein
MPIKPAKNFLSTFTMGSSEKRCKNIHKRDVREQITLFNRRLHCPYT